ncbi:MAG: type II secretion system protein [Sedimentisphaerales bacterium]
MPNTTKKGFTIIELLTVMSIIIILLGVLVPALNKTRRYAKTVVQRGQFHEISKGLELFRNDHSENYPDSGATAPDSLGTVRGYCGAMKLCEALLGQDGMGFNPLSQFTADGIITEPNGNQPDLYPFDLCTSTDPTVYSGPTATNPGLSTNLQSRIKYVDAENIKATRLQDLYTWDITTFGVSFYTPTVAFQATTNLYPYAYPNAVIGDVFLRADIKGAPRCTARAGQKAGMPVLYYKADSSKLNHDSITIPVPGTPNTNIYNFDDNYALTALGCPWESGAAPITLHPMYSDPRVFLKAITNSQITSTPRPHREDSYILVSAGWDGLYGTRDDVYNFSE